ncbi:hypothetical protein, partial [Kitasatospora cineracea]|uniref:hypothetical protein n=1 Tax=Kitasatospora cineracea TaxID=88074 RepID=UPI0033F25DBD
VPAGGDPGSVCRAFRRRNQHHPIRVLLGDTPATVLVYRRAKEYGPKGRYRWRYEYDADA